MEEGENAATELSPFHFCAVIVQFVICPCSSLFVLICAYLFLFVLVCPYLCLLVLILSVVNGFGVQPFVLIRVYSSLFVLIRPYLSLFVLILSVVHEIGSTTICPYLCLFVLICPYLCSFFRLFMKLGVQPFVTCVIHE